MWYTVANTKQFESSGIKAGKVLACKAVDGMVQFFVVGVTGLVVDKDPIFSITGSSAKKYFTKPSKDFDSVVEHSFMICEAHYC